VTAPGHPTYYLENAVVVEKAVNAIRAGRLDRWSNPAELAAALIDAAEALRWRATCQRRARKRARRVK
jgi:hypothetical protein